MKIASKGNLIFLGVLAALFAVWYVVYLHIMHATTSQIQLFDHGNGFAKLAANDNELLVQTARLAGVRK